jgi:uncharacterized OsmC-like protein
MADEKRVVTLRRTAKGQFTATNARGGQIELAFGEPPEFTPVELLLVAIAGCTSLDVDFITAKRAEAESFEVRAEADKVRDEHGNHLQNITVTLSVTFPDGEAGDAARESLPLALARSHDRLCTVSRTIELGTPIDSRLG